MAKRFRYRVRSPFLKYFNDPEQSSLTTSRVIKAKDTPTGSSLFEIADIYKEKVPRKGTGFMLASLFICIPRSEACKCESLKAQIRPSTSPRRFNERDSSEEPELRIDEETCDEAWNLPTSSTIQKSTVAPKQIKSGTRKIAPSKPEETAQIQTPSEAPVAHLEGSVIPKTPRQIKSGIRKIAPSRIQVPTISAMPVASPEVAAGIPTPALPTPEVAEDVTAPKRRPRKKQKKITMPRRAARKPAPSTSGSKRGRKKKVVVDPEPSDDVEPLPKVDNNAITYKKAQIRLWFTQERVRQSKKEEIVDGYWSCTTCQSFFENLFSITSKPLELLNKVLPSSLCHDNRKGCEDAFENAIQLTGALNNIFQNRTNAYSLCLTKIDCKILQVRSTTEDMNSRTDALWRNIDGANSFSAK
ncbi:unnamed protein product [Caenorhabditis nigoni]